MCVCTHARVCVSVRGEAGREGVLDFQKWGGGLGVVFEMGGLSP